MRLKFSSEVVALGAAALLFAAAGPVAAQPTQVGALLITCPGPCQVRVDGQDLGPAPVVARDLLPGPHLIEATGPGGASFRGVTEVAAGRSTAFEIPLGAPQAPTPAPPPPSGEQAVVPSMPGGFPGAAEVAPTMDATAEAEAPLPVGPVPPPTGHEQGGLTPPPSGWNGNYQSYPGLGIALLIVGGGLALPAGAIMVAHAASLFQTHPEREPFEIGGGVLIGGGLLMAAGGVLALILMKGPGAPDESGVVFFAGVEPLFGVSEDGGMVGGRIRW